MRRPSSDQSGDHSSAVIPAEHKRVYARLTTRYAGPDGPASDEPKPSIQCTSITPQACGYWVPARRSAS